MSFVRLLELAGRPISLLEMSRADAARIFNFYGVHRAEAMSIDNLKHVWRVLSMRHHPDRGGRPDAMSEINAAYQELRKHAPWTTPEPEKAKPRPEPERPKPEPKKPEPKPEPEQAKPRPPEWRPFTYGNNFHGKPTAAPAARNGQFHDRKV